MGVGGGVPREGISLEKDHPRNGTSSKELLNLECSINYSSGTSSRHGKGKAHVVNVECFVLYGFNGVECFEGFGFEGLWAFAALFGFLFPFLFFFFCGIPCVYSLYT